MTSIPFCPNCKNRYNITNIIDDIDNLDMAEEKKGGSLKDLDSIIIAILDKVPLEREETQKIDLNVLKKNPTFTKLSKLQKEYVENYILTSQPKKEKKKEVSKMSNYFACNHCGFFEIIPPKTIIFSQKMDSESPDTTSFITEDYKYMIYDNTLPRTKNYTCKNQQCKTHKTPNLKDAVFFRENIINHQLIYMCAVCEHYWKN